MSTKTFSTVVIVLLVIIILPLTIFIAQQPQETRQRAASYPGLHIQGNQIVDGANNRITLQGVDLSGFENGCGGHPYLQSDYDILKTRWNINTIMIPIREQWWTGIGTSYNPPCSPSTYQSNIYTAVQLALNEGFFVGLNMFHNDTLNPSMPQQQAVTAWTDLSHHYLGDPRLFFELYSEPHDVSADVWRNGGGGYYGLQQLADLVHGIDPNRVVLIDSPSWGGHIGQYVDPNNLSTWFTGNNVAYAVHIYDANSNNWAGNFGNLAQKFPVVAAEWGSDDGTCGNPTNPNGYLQTLIRYFGQGILAGYLAWTYDAGSSDMCGRPTFVANWNGDPNSYGLPIYNFYRSQRVILSSESSGNSLPPPPQTPIPTQPQQNPCVSPTPPVGNTNTPTPLPTLSPGTTATPTNTSDTILNFSLTLPGIGSSGNIHPLHPLRSTTITIYNVITNQIITKQAKLLFNGTGFISPPVDLGQLPTGSYQVFVKTNGYLQLRLISTDGTNTFSLSQGTTLTLPPNTMIAGDIAPNTKGNGGAYGDNTLDISDYNLLIGCYGNKATTSSCVDPIASDLDDNGIVDGVDYNIFLRGIAQTQNGDTIPTQTNPFVSADSLLPCVSTTPSSRPTPTQSIQNTPTPHLTPTPIPIGSGFAQVCGTQICINGKPFHIHGATAYGQYTNTVSEMALAKQGNINTLEIVEFENNYHSLSDMMSSGTWTKVDNFIAQAQKNGIHVILHLTSYGQSLQAAGKDYTDATLWQPFFDFIANRTNTVTGIKYSNDPTILMIQLFGEIPASTKDAAFFHNALAYLRTNDPNHILTSGGLSYIDYNSGIDWKTIMSDPNNQVCDGEINSSGDRNISIPEVSTLCKQLSKPWFLSAWSSCYQTGGGDLTHQNTIAGMTTHAQDMYNVEKGAAPAAMPSIGSDFWNLANSAPNPGTCDLSPQFPTVWTVVQSN